VFVLLSSWVTETVGLHALFGAFMAGVIWPQSESVAKEMAGKLETVAMVILLPLFFSYTGIRADVGLVQGASLWLWLVAIIGIAIAAKAGGAFTGARIMGFGTRDSFALGILLNTRGLVELVVLNVGLELGILSQTLFSMMVLMALTTTMMTSPLLRYILPGAPASD
jgi:Kef-type K+ transport system membrane component KefB